MDHAGASSTLPTPVSALAMDAMDYVVDTNWHTFTTVWNSSGIRQSRDGVAQTICDPQLSNPTFLLIQTETGGAGGTPNNIFLPASLVWRWTT